MNALLHQHGEKWNYVFELEYTDEQELLSKMENILKDAERSHVQIIQELAETYENKSSK